MKMNAISAPRERKGIIRAALWMIDISRVQTDRAGVKNNSERRQMTKTNGHRVAFSRESKKRA